MFTGKCLLSLALAYCDRLVWNFFVWLNIVKMNLLLLTNAIRADIPAQLSSIISKALTKDVEVRYQTGTEMARDLKTFLAGLD